jgi:hypothetical protein
MEAGAWICGACPNSGNSISLALGIRLAAARPTRDSFQAASRDPRARDWPPAQYDPIADHQNRRHTNALEFVYDGLDEGHLRDPRLYVCDAFGDRPAGDRAYGSDRSCAWCPGPVPRGIQGTHRDPLAGRRGIHRNEVRIGHDHRAPEARVDGSSVERFPGPRVIKIMTSQTMWPASEPSKLGAISGSTRVIGWFASLMVIFDLSIPGRHQASREEYLVLREQVLLSHSAVANAAAFPVRSPLAEDEVMAAVILQAGQQYTEAELIAFCEPRLPYFAVRDIWNSCASCRPPRTVRCKSTNCASAALPTGRGIARPQESRRHINGGQRRGRMVMPRIFEGVRGRCDHRGLRHCIAERASLRRQDAFNPSPARPWI